MEPVRELTIVLISFNLSPQERQLLCVVSLSKTATFSARNKSMIAPQSGCQDDLPGAGKNQRDYWARNHFRPERCLPASRLGQAGSSRFPYRSGVCNAASDGQKSCRGSMLQRRTSLTFATSSSQCSPELDLYLGFRRRRLFSLLKSFDDGSGNRQDCCRHSLQDEQAWSRSMPRAGWPDWRRCRRQSPYHRRHRAVRWRQTINLPAPGLHISHRG